MYNRSTFQDAINFSIQMTSEELWTDFSHLRQVNADLGSGEKAYWTLPRTREEWRLPKDGKGHSDGKLLMLPVRDEDYRHNAYMAIIPQPMVMHRKVSEVLSTYAEKLFKHFPEENSLARREFGVPMLLGRFDVIVDQEGGIQICELDDVCSLWPALQHINPIADSYMRVLESQLGMPIYTAELFQYADGPAAVSPFVRKEFARVEIRDDQGILQTAYIPRSTSFDLAILNENGLAWRKSQNNTDRDAAFYEHMLKRSYLHNEDHWHGDINDAWLLKKEKFALDEVALSVRAFRDMPGFQAHLDRYGHRSITVAWERDCKWPLVGERLGVLAPNLEAAVKFGEEWEKVHPAEVLVFKTLYSARTERTAIFSSRGTKLKGVSSASQIVRKFGDAAAGPIVIQPYKEPDTLQEAGVTFVGTADENGEPGALTDRQIIRTVEHIGSTTPGERVMAGMENHFSMIFRSFVVYLPKEKRLVHVGGMWQATDGRIVHGGAHSVAGPLYIDGLERHPDVSPTLAHQQAERIFKDHRPKPAPSTKWAAEHGLVA